MHGFAAVRIARAGGDLTLGAPDMFTNRIPLFSLLGIKVGLDFSWFILAILLVWSLASGYFPLVLPGHETATYVWMGIVGAVGLFASIIFHEFAHALVARRYDLPIRHITLFIFGGVAEMEDEPRTSAAEFWMAIAGPIASFLLAGLFLVMAAGFDPQDPGPLAAVIGYLAFINLIVAVFNLLPAFPLDGGRMLRAAVWWFTADFQRATRIAAATGSILAFLLIALGVLNIVAGNFIGGVWLMLIGFFVYSAAGASRAHAELRRSLHGVTVRRIMRSDVVAVPADTPVQKLVDDYFYRHYFKVFPVVDGDGRPVGIVGHRDVGNAKREDWPSIPTSEIMRPLDDENTTSADAPAYKLIQRMQRQGNSRVLVTDGSRLEGIVTLRDVMSFLAIRGELENTGQAADAGAARRTQGPRDGERPGTRSHARPG
jgi:Zn-dependent protease